MLKICLCVALLIATACTNVQDNRSRVEDVSNVTYVSHQVTNTTDLLHRIKINDVASLENDLEEQIASDVRDIVQLIKRGAISSEEAQRLNEHLVMISVLNEKFEIPSIKASKELIIELKLAQKKYPELVQKLRCNDWSKPMWVGKDVCS